LKPWICTLCGEPLDKNMRLQVKYAGAKGGKVHIRCLNQMHYNKSLKHEERNRNIKITRLHHDRIRNTIET
jgi:hypothetical protein